MSAGSEELLTWHETSLCGVCRDDEGHACDRLVLALLVHVVDEVGVPLPLLEHQVLGVHIVVPGARIVLVSEHVIETRYRTKCLLNASWHQSHTP